MRRNIELRRIINMFIPKYKKHVYVAPLKNAIKDKYDIKNNNSDNVLSVLEYIFFNKIFTDYDFWIEYFDADREKILEQYKEKNNLNNVHFIYAPRELYSRGKKYRLLIRNMIRRYSCKYWFTETARVCMDKLDCQTIVCFNYSTPLKIANDTTTVRKYVDHFVETSLLSAMIHCAQYRMNINVCSINGFPRNDNLFECNKKEEICSWIASETDAKYKKIFFYAPTYREYDDAFKGKNILGYTDTECLLEKFLKENDILLIVKMHPMQEIDSFENSKNIIMYKPNYSFSLYDCLAVSDALISDYSSVTHDYLITGKPVIINFFDRRKYENSRGFAFEPVDYICPSKPVENLSSLLDEMAKVLEGNYDLERYEIVRDMFHKYKDNKSTERTIEMLKKILI